MLPVGRPTVGAFPLFPIVNASPTTGWRLAPHFIDEWLLTGGKHGSFASRSALRAASIPENTRTYVHRCTHHSSRRRRQHGTLFRDQRSVTKSSKLSPP